MKKNIENIIKEALISEKNSLPEGHEERFAQKLKAQNKRKSTKQFTLAISGIAAMFLISFWLFNSAPAETPCDELCELIIYTDNTINHEKQNILIKSKAKLSKKDYKELIRDIDKMTLDYEQLKKLKDILPPEEFRKLLYETTITQQNAMKNIIANIDNY